MSTWTTRSRKTKESETGSEDSRRGSGSSSATALAESQLIMLFQQMYKPLGQEEVAYIWRRLEEYTDEVRWHIHKLDGFDCEVILADARTLFLYNPYCTLGIDDQNPSGTVAIQT
ncbi:hypothetical protein ACJ73_02543 [Blastomyces percursus]|uniref:Uncharacterized protein n=1 Tax=Blastomyces percursus TaxID=1658174 RepID=A0A1J9QDC0_9EURO|nr:hypothetical protein ACJ73_02543 [Blastomyces percursus]